MQMPADFNEIQLTDSELELAIFDARCEKYWNTQKERELKAIELAKIEGKKPFTSEQLKNFVLENHPWFKIDEQAKKPFELLCWYFSGDKRFEDAGYSLSKGICISGPVGVGKTDLLNLFRVNKRLSFHFITVFDIERLLHEKGVEYIQTFYSYVPGWGGSPKRFYQPNVGWAFDDVGREGVVFDYGNKTDSFSTILQYRYFQKATTPYNSLHFTTNKMPDELENRYDEAVRSRLREMFNYIKYTGTDRRK